MYHGKGHVVKEKLLDLLADVVGSIVFAVSLQSFTAPNQIAPGGVSGLAVVFNYLTGLSIGLWSLLINLPLLLVGLKFLGRRFTLRTLVSVVILSVTTDLVGLVIPAYQGNELLASIFGGVLMGAGLAVIFMRGSTTGGTDILSKLLVNWFPHLQMGKMLLAVDVVVICFSAVVFRQIETALYGMVSVYIGAKVIDGILYGTETGKLLYIISPRTEEIAQRAMDELGRGCTLLKALGGYSRADIRVLFIALRPPQYYPLKRIVMEIDPDAFLIVTDSTEVLGEGFKPINKE